MIELAQLEVLFQKHGATDFRWIEPQKIVVAQWVRITQVMNRYAFLLVE